VTVIRPAIHSDVAQIAPYVRKADLRELRALGGPSSKEALEALLRSAFPNAYTVEVKGLPAAIVGAIPADDRLRRVALLGAMGTDRLMLGRFSVVRKSREWLDWLHQETGMAVFITAADARNRAHRRWLRWIGFEEVERMEKFGPEGRPFFSYRHLRLLTQNLVRA
jgi:hypothetical protein